VYLEKGMYSVPKTNVFGIGLIEHFFPIEKMGKNAPKLVPKLFCIKTPHSSCFWYNDQKFSMRS
jgi:hypothetical protein